MAIYIHNPLTGQNTFPGGVVTRGGVSGSEYNAVKDRWRQVNQRGGLSSPSSPLKGLSPSELNAIPQEEFDRLLNQMGGYVGGGANRPPAQQSGQAASQGGGSAQSGATQTANLQAPAIAAGYGSGTGLKGSEAAMIGGLTKGLESLDAGLSSARDDVNAGFDSAGERIDPFYQEGVGASRLQAALSGALGADEQQTAYDNFKASPGQEWLRQQTERGVTRNAAATGGLRGGNVLKRLQENAAGLAAQDFDNSFNRLTGVANRGYQAGSQLAGMDAQRGGALGDLSYRSGLTAADMQYGLGNAFGGQRYDAGQRISSNIGSTTNALANLQHNLGQSSSQIISQDSGNLANLLAGIGDSQNASASNLATLLANLSQNQGSAGANQPALGGLIRPDSSIAMGLGGLGNILAAYSMMQKGKGD